MYQIYASNKLKMYSKDLKQIVSSDMQKVRVVQKFRGSSDQRIGFIQQLYAGRKLIQN